RARFDGTEQSGQSRSIHVASRVAAIIIGPRHRDPAFAPLTLNERLGSLPLCIERVKFLIKAFFGRFPGINSAPQASGGSLLSRCILITFSHGFAPYAPGAQ